MNSPPTILLLEPPFHRLFKNTYSLHRFPLALGYLAHAVRRETDWRVLTHNADFHPQNEYLRVAHLAGPGFESYRRALETLHAPAWEELRAVLREHRPDVLAVSTKTQTYPSACRVAELARTLRPNTVVLLGGPHPSMNPQACLENPHVDALVLGEGERTLPELLQAIQHHRPWTSVPGLALREAGRCRLTAARPLIEDLDTLGFPHESAAETLLDYPRYPRDAFRYVFAIRGCPFACVFCGSRALWTRRVRYRSPEHVAAELARLRQLGLREVHFDDDTFGVRQDYIRKLCSALRATVPDLRWSCELHVNLVNEPMLAALRAAGCYRVQLGIESGSDAVLKSMRKGYSYDRARRAALAIRRAGLELHAFFMVGFPTETRQTLAQTRRALQTLPASRLMYSIFTPYPGTEAFELCHSAGLISDRPDLATLYHQSHAHCFTPHIPPQTFREEIARIEDVVDRRNRHARIRELLSPHTLRRAAQLGPAGALRKALRVLGGK